ncbi:MULTISPECIES: flagellar hook-associated protein FlgK [unclassified Halomonas]|uniref:flagellar hook-associated protein FlgK n=1 Tax=unclassified Halomonas TaxID=2609666 RepID=UPI0020A16C83|nr:MULTISPECIES: flagellar hook-associated protein FlgK [unclassified Halomonas]MCP1315121.1 flagellar hook-associated protein FlgK [Halomonas sp. 707D7]MCP1325767.1 flagellar hook-associated protein FlgK [Halomonas sp. 707D4]
MSMFSIGLSGLNAAQSALTATSNNVSNVFTPGYNREITLLGETKMGKGVQVNAIERQFNTYVASQLNNAKTQSSALQTYNNQVSQIDNLLADRAAGLSPLMQGFFSSLEDLASAPSDPASRQGVLGTANTLSAQFRAFDGYLQDMQDNINGQIKDEVTQINNTLKQIADFNKEISLARARSGEAPNSLLNQRDQLVSELNERMDVRLNIQDGKSYNISLPDGQPLVVGADAFRLDTLRSDTDPQRLVVGYSDGRGNVNALQESTIKGGALGGLMSFRSETLDKTQNQIGQLAVSLSVAFNEQHKQGVDLNGQVGGDFFMVRDPEIYGSKGNSGDASVSAQFDPDTIDQLRASDYTVRFDGSVPVVTRGDSRAVVTDADWNAQTQELTFGGMKLTFDGTPVDGDRFEVQPVRRAANGMQVAITDVDKIAAADAGFDGTGGSPLNSLTRSGNLDVSGLTSSPTAFSANKRYELQVSDDGKLSVSPQASVRVNGNAFDPTADGAVLEAGDEVTIDGVSFTLDALPGEDETATLTVSQNIISANGDNRNALALQELQGKRVVGGVSSVSSAYASIVSDVGNRANITQVNLDARQGLTDQLRAVQQSESGVNLDEEAANLIRYQQFYMANARVIDTAGTIMDTILNLRS